MGAADRSARVESRSGVQESRKSAGMAVHGLRQACLERVLLIACCHETMVKCEVAVSGTERMILSTGLDQFGAYSDTGTARRDRAPFGLCQRLHAVALLAGRVQNKKITENQSSWPFCRGKHTLLGVFFAPLKRQAGRLTSRQDR